MFKSSWNVSKFWNFKKVFDKIFLIIYSFFLGWGGCTPNFGPSMCCVSKNEHPSTKYDPTFFLLHPFYSKNGDDCKKQELNMLRIDWDMKVLSKTHVLKSYEFVFLQQVFNFCDFFLYMVGIIAPFFYMWD